MSQEDQLTTNFFLPLIDCAICYLIDRYEEMHTVGAVFNFLYNKKSICEIIIKRIAMEINDELERLVIIARKSKEDLKTANNFLT